MGRDSEWLYILDCYLNKLHQWDVKIDHEDGSTAPFTSLALGEVCQNSK